MSIVDDNDYVLSAYTHMSYFLVVSKVGCDSGNDDDGVDDDGYDNDDENDYSRVLLSFGNSWIIHGP